MSAPNSGMAIHTLAHKVDRFSLHCNSIHSTVSIVHPRVILTFLIPLLRVYINQHSSNAYSVQFKFQLVQQCIQISTRINSSSVHTYICVCFIRNYIPIPFSNGLLTNNSTSSTSPTSTISQELWKGLIYRN